MEYQTIQNVSDKWNISKRRIQILCKEGRIPGAKMIGNMWVIPNSAKKPLDARTKSPIIKENQLSIVRSELKKLLRLLYLDCPDVDEKEKRCYILTAIAGGLCSLYLGEQISEKVYIKLYNDLSGCEISETFQISQRTKGLVKEFIDLYKEENEIDDILSWSYQYLNKSTKDNQYSPTQFFTEKYMIKYLVQNIPDIIHAKKILDPCCGGGNFLVECLEFLSRGVDKTAYVKLMLSNVNKLYGYDIDSHITRVAVVNIKLKVFSLLKRANIEVELDLWDRISPNIFRSSALDEYKGSLSLSKEDCINVITGVRVHMDQVLGDSDIVLTNPPFSTIKGMKFEQKQFLKEYYPDTNCDTCVAFISAIRRMLKPKGYFGVVTQNAWMHLKSFEKIRAEFTSSMDLCVIINLGSGAFQDLSGEKSNVSLLIGKNPASASNITKTIDFSTLPLKDKVRRLEEEITYNRIEQNELDSPNGYDLSEGRALKKIEHSRLHYRDIAVPMQGTSTGNARELVGYYWEHFGDDEWVPVSNGGGYCRWKGLNNCVVKWGDDAEYIRAQKGSALRNVKYFPTTQMVFSDTGTAGLNVRVLLKGQIFIASGPGIRINEGNEYAHLALLNSRIASYYLRMMSPKLTIAAGYIGQIPITERICSSVVLEKNAKLCIELKEKMLSTRPFNIEYNSDYLSSLPKDIDVAAWSMFYEDLTNELLKLEVESKIDNYILKEYGFEENEIEQITDVVGQCAYSINGNDQIDVEKLDVYLNKLIDAACCLKRSKTSRNAIGSDGVLEFTAKDLSMNPEIIVKNIQEVPTKMPNVLNKYKGLIIHNSVMELMGFNTANGLSNSCITTTEAVDYLIKRFGRGMDYHSWLETMFNKVHCEVFKGTPVISLRNCRIEKNDYRIKG